MNWFDAQMQDKRTSEASINDYWNNYLQFCTVMEVYLSLCYAIKWGDIGFLKSATQEVTIILQASSTKKPKYARKMLCQMHILDTTAVDSILKEAYIVNALVNP